MQIILLITSGSFLFFWVYNLVLSEIKLHEKKKFDELVKQRIDKGSVFRRNFDGLHAIALEDRGHLIHYKTRDYKRICSKRTFLKEYTQI